MFMTRNIGRTKTRLIRRFLDDEGNLICPVTFSFFPFGGGPRGCVGQSVAKIEISPFSLAFYRRSNSIFPQAILSQIWRCQNPLREEFLTPRSYKLCFIKRDTGDKLQIRAGRGFRSMMLTLFQKSSFEQVILEWLVRSCVGLSISRSQSPDPSLLASLPGPIFVFARLFVPFPVKKSFHKAYE